MWGRKVAYIGNLHCGSISMVRGSINCGRGFLLGSFLGKGDGMIHGVVVDVVAEGHDLHSMDDEVVTTVGGAVRGVDVRPGDVTVTESCGDHRLKLECAAASVALLREQLHHFVGAFVLPGLGHLGFVFQSAAGLITALETTSQFPAHIFGLVCLSAVGLVGRGVRPTTHWRPTSVHVLDAIPTEATKRTR